MSSSMSGLHHTTGGARRGRARIIACVLGAAALALLPAVAEADSRRRPYRPTGRDRSLSAADALGRVFFSERQRRAAHARRVTVQTPAPPSASDSAVEAWLSHFGEVDTRDAR